MQNKTVHGTKALKTREDEGWMKLHQQLEVEMPQKKKKDRSLIWFFFAAGLGILGLSWYGYLQVQKGHIKTIKEPELVETSSEEVAKLQNNTPPTNEIQSASSTASSTNATSNKDSLNKNQTAAFNPNGNRLGAGNYLADTKNNSDEKTALIFEHVNRRQNIDKKHQPHPSLQAEPKKMESQDLRPNLTNLNLDSDNNEVQVKTPATASSSTNHELPKTHSEGNIDLKHNLQLPDEAISGRSSALLDHLPVLLTSLTTARLLILPAQIPIGRLAGNWSVQKSKKWNGNVQILGDLAIKRYSGVIIAPGLSRSLGAKWSWSTQLGLGYHFNHTQSLLYNSSSQSSGSLGPAADSKSQFSVGAGNIFLDASNAVTRYVNNNLYISTADQVLVKKDNHSILHVQSAINYFLTSRWYLGAGCTAQKTLNQNNYTLLVNSNTSNAVSLNSRGTEYKVIGQVEPMYLYLMMQSGYRISRRVDVSFGFSTSAILNTGASNSNNPLNNDPQSVPTLNQSKALNLPKSENNGALRFGLNYKF